MVVLFRQHQSGIDDVYLVIQGEEREVDFFRFANTHLMKDDADNRIAVDGFLDGITKFNLDCGAWVGIARWLDYGATSDVAELNAFLIPKSIEYE